MLLLLLGFAGKPCELKTNSPRCSGSSVKFLALVQTNGTTTNNRYKRKLRCAPPNFLVQVGFLSFHPPETMAM
eukprot:3217408-Amphidinium_carterae.1